MARYFNFLILVALVTFWIVPACDIFSENETPEGIDLVEEVWEIVLEDYVDSDNLDSQVLAEAAIQGLINSLDDPYTSYLSPEQNESSKEDLEGGFNGIGVTLTIRNNELSVVAPIIGSPAEAAGIKPGDIILEIDGESAADLSLVEAMLKIRGEVGTAVTLVVLHDGEESPIEISIVRELIEVPSVILEMLDQNIAHITITNFTNRTGSEFDDALSNIVNEDLKGIILDLRNNPGGIVTAAVDVVSQFVDEGIVVYALDNKNKRSDWMVEKGGLALDIPLVVLVNDYSASASEVVAGALQDYGRGVLLGTTTYGKGYMQTVHDLSNGGSLHIVFARWYTPNGRQIQGKGIIPDIEVENTTEDIANGGDLQLDRAIEYLTIMGS